LNEDADMMRLAVALGWTRRLVTPIALAASINVGTITLSTRPAFAQTDAALAESLFREGKRLVAANKFSEACPKFAESYRLDPGLGTLLNLATCYESEGKIASAWAQYSEAAARARRENDPDRAEFADERVNALEPQLPRLSVSVAKEAEHPGLIVKLDGQPLNNAVLGVPLPVDPGVHQLEASANGKETWTQSIKFEPGAPVIAVTIAPLKDKIVPATNSAPAPGVQPGVTTQPGVTPTLPNQQRTNRALVWASIATGAMAVGTLTTGILYAQKRADFEKSNDNLDPKRFSERESATTLGIVNLIFVGGTAVAGGITIYLLATGSAQKDRQQAAASDWQLIPVVGPTGGALSLRGSL
jgi:hypothetical protein